MITMPNNIVFVCPYCGHTIKCNGKIYGVMDSITRTIHCDNCDKNVLVKNCKTFY